MNAFMVFIATVICAILLFILWLRMPLKGTLDQLRLNQWLRGFILFGMDGSYIEIYGLSKRGNILLRKKYRAGNTDIWDLEVSVYGGDIISSFIKEIERWVDGFEGRLCSSEGGTEGCTEGKVQFTLSGDELNNYRTLEILVRFIVKCLAHQEGSRYRLDFLGPKDNEKADKYYSELNQKIKCYGGSHR
jgi:hypothetical protein